MIPDRDLWPGGTTPVSTRIGVDLVESRSRAGAGIALSEALPRGAGAWQFVTRRLCARCTRGCRRGDWGGAADTRIHEVNQGAGPFGHGAPCPNHPDCGRPMDTNTMMNLS